MIDPDDAVQLAEQATLGGLILAPHHLDTVRRWLRPADFTDPWHARVYGTLCERHSAGEAITPVTVGTDLQDQLGRQHDSAVRVHDLLQATPAKPVPADYARMVLETGLRREIADVGVLLRAGALQSTLSGESVPMAATCALVDASLSSTGARWARATGAPAEDDAPIPLRAALRSPDLRLGADKLLRLHPHRDPAQEPANEAALVGCLIAHPEAIPDVARWLRPNRLVTPSWRGVYAATVELSELGHPVDAVTVAWATRRLSHHDQPSPDLRVLLEAVDGGRFAVPDHAARLVAADQMQRIAENGSQQLLAGSQNPGVLVPDLVDTGRLVTAALRQAAAVLPERRGGPSAPPLAVVRSLEAARGPVAG
jgi:hypothetical protein